MDQSATVMPLTPDTSVIPPKKSFFSHFSTKQKIGLSLMGLLVIALPAAIFALSLQTDLRSRAATSNVPPIISTSSLLPTAVGLAYRTTITGQDTGYSNNLQMTISQLPNNFYLDPRSNMTGCTLTNTNPTPTPTLINPPPYTSITLTPPPPSISITPIQYTPTPTTTPIIISATPTMQPPATTNSRTDSAAATPTPPTKIVLTRECTIMGNFPKDGSYPVTILLANPQTGLSATKTLYIAVSSSPSVTPTPTKVTITPTPTTTGYCSKGKIMECQRKGSYCIPSKSGGSCAPVKPTPMPTKKTE